MPSAAIVVSWGLRRSVGAGGSGDALAQAGLARSGQEQVAGLIDHLDVAGIAAHGGGGRIDLLEGVGQRHPGQRRPRAVEGPDEEPRRGR